MLHSVTEKQYLIGDINKCWITLFLTKGTGLVIGLATSRQRMVQNGDPNNSCKVTANVSLGQILQDQSYFLPAIPVYLLQ